MNSPTTGMWDRILDALDRSLTLKYLFYRLVWLVPRSWRPTSSARSAMEYLERTREKVVFVHIGANDGLTQDPIAEFVFRRGWSGVMVEPVPAIFKRLSEVYRKVSRVKLENAAISSSAGSLKFWYLNRTPDMPHIYDTVGSFSREHVVSILGAGYDSQKYLASIDVPTLTFSQLLTKHGLDKVDLVSIDTEGHDGKIVKQIDFGKWQPEVVMYESEHLAQEEAVECKQLLERNGYTVLDVDGNAVATRKQGGGAV